MRAWPGHRLALSLFLGGLAIWIAVMAVVMRHAALPAEASDVIGAVKKGVADGKKQLVDVPLTKANSIPHPIEGRGGAAKVMLRPAAPGLEMAGVKNVLAKQLGSDNPLNNARAAVNALDMLRTFAEVAEERGLSLEQVYG